MKKLGFVFCFVLSACAVFSRQPPGALPLRGMVEKVAPHDYLAANMSTHNALNERIVAPHFTFDVECIGDCGGTGGWHEIAYNTVLTGGGNDLLDKYFKGSAYTAAWYLELKAAGSIASTDTPSSHAGWVESNPYSGNRPAITFGTTSARSNAATAVSYTINGTATVAGACITSVNTGTTGILYSCTDFSGARSVVSGDTLNVTPTVTD